MKPFLFCVVATLLAAGNAFSQGQFIFNNRALPDVNAPFVLCTDPPGVSSVAGSAFHVELFGAIAGAPVDQLHPLGTTDFRTGLAAGYVNPLVLTVPGAWNGTTATVLVRAFDGNTWDAAKFRYEGLFSVLVVEPPGEPLLLPMGTSPLVLCTVPEPSSALLVLVGFAIVLCWTLWTVDSSQTAGHNSYRLEQFN